MVYCSKCEWYFFELGKRGHLCKHPKVVVKEVEPATFLEPEREIIVAYGSPELGNRNNNCGLYQESEYYPYLYVGRGRV